MISGRDEEVEETKKKDLKIKEIMPETAGGGKKRWHELGLILDTGTL